MPDRRRPTCLVTGGASGIGAAVARRFEADGWDVWTFDRQPRDRDGGGDGSDGDSSGPARTRHVVGDVRDAEALAGLADVIARGHDGIDALVACAGVKVRGRIDAIDAEAFDEALAINLKGAFLAARAVVGHMRAAQRGSIVFVGSGSAYGDPDAIAYAAAKGGLHALGASLATDLAADRVRVNVVVPGFVDSPMAAGASAARRAELARSAVAGRLTTPDDVADVIAFLCSPAAATLSGGFYDVGHAHQQPVAPAPRAHP